MSLHRRNPRNKYGAKPHRVDGILFASIAEARRYCELKILEKAGQIEDLELQPVFVLIAPQPFGGMPSLGIQYPESTIGKYIGDFKYFDKCQQRCVVEDVKGFKTPLYRWKKKHVEAQYGITVVEIEI